MTPRPPDPPKRPRPRHYDGRTSRAVLTLFRQGKAPAEIRAELGVSRQYVHQILTEHGRDGAARTEAWRERRAAAARERFRAAWEAAPDLAAAAAALGTTPARASRQASLLRSLGVPLKAMPARPKPRPGAQAVERLYRRGWGVPAIIRRTGLSRGYVYPVVRKLRLRDGTLDPARTPAGRAERARKAAALRSRGLRLKAIARRLGVCVNTVARDLARAAAPATPPRHGRA